MSPEDDRPHGSLSVEQVLALAPDPAAAAAARKLGAVRTWKNLGRSERALWGECQGSALYQVRVDLTDLASKCTCPSRKFPCKHALGLMLLAATTAGAFVESPHPEWLAEWIAKRVATAEKKEARAAAPEKAPDPEAQAKRAEQRLARVRKGVDALDLWLADLTRSGLATVEGQPESFWEAQAARLVDAQAPALASRVRRLGNSVGGDADWPARLLDEMGRIALLTQALRRIDALPPLLQADVRQQIGWSLTQDEVVANGETLADDWVVMGQWTDDDDRIRVQRSWLVGTRSNRTALVLQFAAGQAPFGENLIPGTAFEGELAFWPSAAPQRALIRSRTQAARAWSGGLPGFDRIDAFLGAVTDAAARQPWFERTAASLRNVTPVHLGARGRWVRDAEGNALRVGGRGDSWALFALSGGAPIDLAAEWDGDRLQPLALVVDGAYHLLWTGV
ncbi:MAG TPA: SWIM zinc finger family protein [Polyangiaceae bacterium]